VFSKRGKIALGVSVTCGDLPMHLHWNFLIRSILTRCERSESDNPMHRAIELRKTKRYPVSAPALFMWAPANGKPHSAQGVTRDINTFGVYVKTSAVPPLGALVQMEIVLPKLGGDSPGMRLQGEGIVLRCDFGDAAKCGFAASAQFYPETAESVLSQIKGAVQTV